MQYSRDARLAGAILPLLFALSFFWTTQQIQPAHAQPGQVQPSQDQAQKTIYWGALISGATYGRDNPPWDEGAIDQFEQNAGKPISILHWGQAWWQCRTGCGYQEFRSQQPQFEAMRRRGIIPLVDWSAWDSRASRVDQPAFSLQKIIDGEHDDYIRRWATEARGWGQPFFLRFNWEMNGDWFPWSERVNGNRSGQYVQAWRHVHDIFRAVGADNVTWVWCPNVVFPKAIPLAQLYPGDAYVDWTCMDGYNWGERPPSTDRFQSFSEIFTATYHQLLQISPAKPIMIGETASSEIGGSKAEWIASAFGSELPTSFPRVEAVLWFNWNTEGMGWAIETSPAAQAAFAGAIASTYYSEARFNLISASPIPPFGALPGGCRSNACLFLPQVSTE